MIKESWLAFALALMSPRFLFPEDAFLSLADGVIRKQRRNWDEIIPEIMALHDNGISWTEIDEMFGYAKHHSVVAVSRYKNRHKSEGRMKQPIIGGD